MDTNDMLRRVAHLSDPDLLAQVKHLAQREREAAVALIVHLAELDERRLYLAEGYPSLFRYCTDVLHLSEHATYNRIETARAVRRYPVLLEHLAAGWTTLFAVRLLAPHLTPENHHDVLARARHRSKRELEELIARLRPQPPVPDVIRKLPVRTQAASRAPLPVETQDASSTSQDDDTHEIRLVVAPAAMPGPAPPAAVPLAPPARRAVVSPLAAERYKIQFTASAEVHAKLREAQALLRHQIPDGDLEQIFDRALEALLATLRKQKLAATTHPQEHRRQASGAPANAIPNSRHIPAAVRRAVWARDGGRCAFVSANGHRCAEEAFLEFHHVVPYAHGGPATAENVELRCRAHNGYEAERRFRRGDTAAVREESGVYGSDALSAGGADMPGDRATNSFRNEFPRRPRSSPSAYCRTSSGRPKAGSLARLKCGPGSSRFTHCSYWPKPGSVPHSRPGSRESVPVAPRPPGAGIRGFTLPP